MREISVQKKWPNQLIIKLVEYKPKAYWNSYDEILLEGNSIVKPKYFNDQLSLPIFYGDVDNLVAIDEMYKKLQTLALSYGINIIDIEYKNDQWKINLDLNFTVWLTTNKAQEKIKYVTLQL